MSKLCECNRTNINLLSGICDLCWNEKFPEESKISDNWIPSSGEIVWIKVFSNWSSGSYIGFDTVKNVHLVREDKQGGGHLMSSSEILPYSAMPNQPKKQTLDDAAFKYAKNDNTASYDFTTTTLTSAFIAGANWQSEKICSEDNLKNFIKIIDWYDYNSDVRPTNTYDVKETIDNMSMWEWFEQFKRKIK